jgi:hypothetical protein
LDSARLIPTASDFAALTLTEAEKKHKDLIAIVNFTLFTTKTPPKKSVAASMHFNAS